MAHAQTDEEIVELLSRLFVYQDSMQVITMYCTQQGVNILDVLTRKYKNKKFAELLIKLYDLSSKDSAHGDPIVPANSEDVDWKILESESNYKYANNLIESVEGQELLKEKHHPETTSAFKRLLTVVLWHVLLYTETVNFQDYAPLLQHYAAELKSTMFTIPFCPTFVAIHNVTDKVYIDAMTFLKPWLYTIIELQKQRWWINTFRP